MVNVIVIDTVSIEPGHEFVIYQCMELPEDIQIYIHGWIHKVLRIYWIHVNRIMPILNRI